jgi:hypothetical protein
MSQAQHVRDQLPVHVREGRLTYRESYDVFWITPTGGRETKMSIRDAYHFLGGIECGLRHPRTESTPDEMAAYVAGES